MNQTITKDLKRPQMTLKNANKNDELVSKNAKTKNSLRGGDPNDINLLIEGISLNKPFLLP